MKKAFFLTLMFFLWIMPVHAHQLWIFPENGSFVVTRRHMPDQMEPYDPKCVKEVMAVDGNGNSVALYRKDEEKRAILQSDKDVAVMAVQCDWGFRVTTTRGKKLISRKQALEQGLKV